jgi:hypothetical protein
MSHCFTFQAAGLKIVDTILNTRGAPLLWRMQPKQKNKHGGYREAEGKVSGYS